jgi:hypothetical protein
MRQFMRDCVAAGTPTAKVPEIFKSLSGLGIRVDHIPSPKMVERAVQEAYVAGRAQLAEEMTNKGTYNNPRRCRGVG